MEAGGVEVSRTVERALRRGLVAQSLFPESWKFRRRWNRWNLYDNPGKVAETISFSSTGSMNSTIQKAKSGNTFTCTFLK